MAKKFDLDKALKSLTRNNLNRIVHKYIFAYDFTEFSSNLSQLGLPYASIIRYIQKGLYKNMSSDRIRNWKGMPNSGSLPEYMSPMELIQYRDAMNKTIQYLNDPNENVSRYDTPHALARRAADSVFDEFDAYEESPSPEWIYYEKHEGPVGGLIKTFDRTIKCGQYDKFISSSPLRTNKVTDFSSDSGFNPVKYETYQKNFVKLIEYLNKECSLPDGAIKSLFSLYESKFYNTSFLSDKNVTVIDYSLGLTKGRYFSAEDLENFETEIGHFLASARFYKSYTAEKVISNAQKISYFNDMISKVAEEERKKYIEEHIPVFKRPETSNVFLVACLDTIAAEIVKNDKKKDKPISPEEREKYSTQDMKYFPNTFIEKALCVKENLIQKKKGNESVTVQPTFWDVDLMDEPPVDLTKRAKRTLLDDFSK